MPVFGYIILKADDRLSSLLLTLYRVLSPGVS